MTKLLTLVIKDHTDLLNFIAHKIMANTYLELGVFNPDNNFNKIGVPYKTSVDPNPLAKASFVMTSDWFFEKEKDTYDLIFIDGLHHADQVRKDLLNAWDRLNEGGVIVLHDCNPPTEKTTCVPRGNQGEWCGDVWKVAVNVGGGNRFTVDFDYGCMVIQKVGEIIIDDEEYDWKYFDDNRKSLLNLVTIDQAIQRIDSWNNN